MAHPSDPGQRTWGTGALLCLTALLTSCNTPAQATSPANTPASAAATQTDGPATATAEPPTPVPTEAPPTGKLLDACALVPPETVLDTFGENPIADGRRSVWQATAGQAWGDDQTFYSVGGLTILSPRTLYECKYSLTNGFDDWTTIEVYEDPVQALQQMDSTLRRYNGYLQGEGVETMVEVDGLGDLAYALKPNITTDSAGMSHGFPMRSYPTLYIASGPYLIRIALQPATMRAGAFQRVYDSALAVARQALSQMPADIHSLMADQELGLNSAGQPEGKGLEPCALVLRSEVEARFNVRITSETSDSYWRNSGSASYRCTYEAEGAGGMSVAIEELERLPEFLGDALVSGLEEVSGIGDKAFRGALYGGDSDLIIVVGSAALFLDVHGFGLDRDGQFEGAMALAELALERLP